VPNRIHLLDEQVANQIAAGEVVERPASVVKELVENALDAGATRVDVEVEQAGKQMIRVTDDGWGMSRDDALLSLERHATSKVRTARDVLEVASMGFRGEAVPSIASVSQFRLRTAEHGVVGGTELSVNGGRIEWVRDTGCPAGTQVEVRRLFLNVPGRRKFLRSDDTELAHIEQLFRTFALAHPGVALRLIVDGRTVRELPATGDALRRVRDLCGEAFVSELVPVDSEHDGWRLRGWVGRAGVSRGSRSDEWWFVNRRPVDNRTLYHGLREAYQNALMKGRHPVAVLFLELPPSQVDVNVHPAKREVRFREDFRVRRLVVDTVGEALRARQASPLPVATAPPPVVPAPAPVPAAPDVVPEADPAAAVVPPLQLIPEAPAAPEPEQRALPLSLGRVTPVPAPAREVAAGGMRLRVMGVVAETYVVAESERGLVLIDQHAAHERVMFERVLRQRLAGEAPSQRLLLPVTVELGPREAAALREWQGEMDAVGLIVREFGRNTFVVEAIPPFFRPERVRDTVRDVLDELRGTGGETRARRGLSEEIMCRIACRAAVKAHDRLGREELERLLEDLLACDLPYTCPHGRPTMILFGVEELERKFGRVV
jgi:DNA mismatch repair protein MutL